jgi:hypothetical protein
MHYIMDPIHEESISDQETVDYFNDACSAGDLLVVKQLLEDESKRAFVQSGLNCAVLCAQPAVTQ